LQVRDLAALLLVCLRDERVSEHPVPTEEFAGNLDPIQIDARVLTNDLVDHQTKLVRGMWFGNYLQTKLCRDQNRIVRLMLTYARLCGEQFSV
jgi:hypothetical protein